MLKVLIVGTVASQKMKKLWSYINDSLYQKLSYATVSRVIAHLLKLQQEDLIA